MKKRDNGCLTAIGILLAPILVIAIGYLVGRSTYLASYRILDTGTVQSYISGDQSNGYQSYLQLANDTSVYIVPESALSPTFNYGVLGSQKTVQLTIIPDSSEDIDVKATDGFELKGKGYEVVSDTVLDGKNQSTFSTQDYSLNPDGYQHDRSNIGNWIMIIGAGFLAIMIWFALASVGIVITPG